MKAPISLPLFLSILRPALALSSLADSTFTTIPTTASFVPDLPATTFTTIATLVVANLPDTTFTTIPTSVVPDLPATTFTTIATFVVANLPDTTFTTIPTSVVPDLPATMFTTIPTKLLDRGLDATSYLPAHTYGRPPPIPHQPTSKIPIANDTISASTSASSTSTISPMLTAGLHSANSSMSCTNRPWVISNLRAFTAFAGIPTASSNITFDLKDEQGGSTVSCVRSLPPGSGSTPTNLDTYYPCQNPKLGFLFGGSYIYVRLQEVCNGNMSIIDGSTSLQLGCYQVQNGTICVAPGDVEVNLTPVITRG